MKPVTGLFLTSVAVPAALLFLGCAPQRSMRAHSPAVAAGQEGGAKGMDARRAPGELDENEAGEGEEKVAFASLPGPVRTAAEEALAGASDLSAEKETEAGVTHYEVAGWKGGKGITVTLSADGEVVEFEREISFSDLPRAAQERMRKDHPNVSFGVIELVEPRYYELKFKSGGKAQEVQVYPSGMLKKD